MPKGKYPHKPHTEEWKKEISAKLKGRNEQFKNRNYRGKNHPKWKGGISRHYWTKQTLIRDDYTCQICGLRDPEIMEVDHIKPVSIAPELFSEPSNLITICPNCHRRKTKRDRKIIAEYKRHIALKVKKI